MVSRKCMEVVLEGIWEASGRCLNGVSKVYESCPEGIWKVSGMDLESSCKHASTQAGKHASKQARKHILNKSLHMCKDFFGKKFYEYKSMQLNKESCM